MQRLCLLVRPLSLVMGWCLLLAASPLARAAGLKVGVAVTDITPPVGWRMSGYFYERVSTKIHDPLQGKALVFRQGDEKAALVFCDLNAIPRDLSSRVRTQASRKTGIPERSILLAATHTHTGPLYFGALREYLHETAISTQGRDP